MKNGLCIYHDLEHNLKTKYTDFLDNNKKTIDIHVKNEYNICVKLKSIAFVWAEVFSALFFALKL